MTEIMKRIEAIKEQKETEYREYAEAQFLRRHMKDRIAYLMGRKAPQEMINRALADYDELSQPKNESRQCYQH